MVLLKNWRTVHLVLGSLNASLRRSCYMKRALFALVLALGVGMVGCATDVQDPVPPAPAPVAQKDPPAQTLSGELRDPQQQLLSGIGVDPEIARIVDETRALFVERLTSGFVEGPMPGVDRAGYASGILGSPIVRLALRGWVGFAEAASLGWTEAIAAGAPTPSQENVRALLANALMEIVRSATISLATTG